MTKPDEYKTSKEYLMWESLKEICDKLRLRNENDVIKIDDMNDYWEPLLEGLFKMGVIFKQTKKLKEIKVDWIRPIFYIKSENFVVMDGKKYDNMKEAMSEGQNVQRAFLPIIANIQQFEQIENAAVFKKMKTQLQKVFKEFYDSLIVYIKNGFPRLHANIKEILKPLLILRKANFHLFQLESKEYQDAELTLFMDRKDFNNFILRIQDHFQNEEYKNKKDVTEIDKFTEYLYKNITHKPNLEYEYSGQKRDDNSIYLAPNRFHKEALQKKFEEALDFMLKYLYDRKKEDFDSPINVNKLFQIINILGQNPLECIKYYLDEKKKIIREMKIKLYEMKINGLCRIKMPICKNEDLIRIIKNLYDMHKIVEFIMGDKLKYDQYSFFYNNLKFIHDSSIKKEMETIKNKSFMDNAIPNFIILSAMRQAASILEKMRLRSLSSGKSFQWDDYFQIKKMPLDTELGYFINSYEMDESMKKRLASNPEIKLQIETLQSEIMDFGGRFWILEGFFDPEDRALWLEGIEILRNINTLVIDDIRDYILMNSEMNSSKHQHQLSENKSIKNFDNSLSFKHKESKKITFNKEKSLTKSIGNHSNNYRNISSSKTKKNTVKNNNRDSLDSDDDSILNSKTKNIKLDFLRPPFVWNYPIDLHKKKNEKKGNNEEKIYEVRNIDPVNIYKDGRVKSFLNILNIIKDKVLNFSNEKKGYKWDLYFEKTLAIWNINYVSSSKKKSNVSMNKKFDEYGNVEDEIYDDMINI